MAGCEASARKKLKYLRELGVFEKVDERAAVAKYNVTPVDTKWVATGNAFEWEPMHIRSRNIAREPRRWDKPELFAGTPPLEALKAVISTVASGSPEFSPMHVDVSRACFHAKAQGLVLVKLRVEECSGKDKGKIGLLKKSMYGARDAACNWEPVPPQEKENFGFDTPRRPCGDRKEQESVGAQEATGERVSNQSKHHLGLSTKSIKALNRRTCWILYQHDPRHVDVLVDGSSHFVPRSLRSIAFSQ